MSILNRYALMDALRRGTVRSNIEPTDPKVGPNSIDVSLGDEMLEVVPNARILGIIPAHDYTKEPKTRKVPLFRDKYFVLWPRRTYLSIVNESFYSEEYVQQLYGRSTIARGGTSTHLSAGFGDLGWDGKFVLELVNHNRFPVLLCPGMDIAQVAFTLAQGRRRKMDLYGQCRKSHYQNQGSVVGSEGLVSDEK